MPYQLVWLIFLLPLFSFIIVGLFLRPFLKNQHRTAGYVTIAAIAGSLGLSLWALFDIMATGQPIAVPDVQWAVVDGLTINLGLIMDELTAIMLVVVTTVSLMVQIYSQGYMKGDAGYQRYYAFMSLFTASMLGLVLADNLLLVYVFWEMVGLCSYLLIGFWFHKPSAANAAKKAFIVTRLGDFGFLAAILLIYFNTGTLDINQLHTLAATGALAGSTLTWAAIGIFAGAAGKSAQFPLHTWLPDAMEGPTPVSALIHAATMVAAGVFLVARTFPLFAHSLAALNTVAIIGAFTALFAATMGLVMNDIKRVLAYSTISQLGYMMLGLGAAGLVLYHEGDVTVVAAKAAVAIGMFHLFNHAFFKSLLFLGAGSVNHATGTFDMTKMGGLRKFMPWTFATFLIGAISLAGIWPISGFWSKDEILAVALDANSILFILAIITVFLTAFYMFRAVFMTFGGEYRGGEGDHKKPHESPLVMIAPMVVLAILAVFSGFWNVHGGFGAFMGHGETKGFLEGFFGIFTNALPWISLALAGLGILLAYAIYSKKWLSAEKIGRMFKPLYNLFVNKYWLDTLYEKIFVGKVLLRGFFAGLQGVDVYGVDGAVNGLAAGAMNAGKALRRAHSGQLQLYGLFIGIGIVVIVACLFIFG
ncbi:MAG: NADH-quinone oxidoreductase subunit L [Dehalococcoidia bacterium]|jgi:NADH-quinone oxidoreductase subunit L